MSKDIYILAIESSCDDMSVAIVKNGVTNISMAISSQIDIHAKFGGVVPEIASREHLKSCINVLDECLKNTTIKIEDVDAIAVTYKPGLVGSLMIGVELAKTLSFIYDKPLIGVNHMFGHIYSNNLTKELTFPALILTVSGGHTDISYMTSYFDRKIIGTTLDDALGECYDKVARIMDLEYPGGPKIDKLYYEGKNSYKLPLPMNDGSLNFSFSGLKSAVINLVNKETKSGKPIIKEDLACSFQTVVEDILRIKLSKAIEITKPKILVIAGGVSANTSVRKIAKELSEKYNLEYAFPEMEYCTDNAAMIGAVAYYQYLNNDFKTLDLKVESCD